MRQCVWLKVVGAVVVSRIVMAMINMRDRKMMVMARGLVMLVRHQVMHPDRGRHDTTCHGGHSQVTGNEHRKEQGSRFAGHRWNGR